MTPADFDAIMARVEQTAGRLADTLGRPALDAALTAARAEALGQVVEGLVWAAAFAAMAAWMLHLSRRVSARLRDDKPCAGDERDNLETRRLMAAFFAVAFAAGAVGWLVTGLSPVTWIGIVRPDSYLAHRAIFGDG